MRYKIECFVRGSFKGMLIHYQVVGGRHDDISTWIERHYLMGKVSGTGSCVLSRGFADNIGIADLGYLLLQRIYILLIGNKVDVFLGTYMLEAVVRPLYE